VWHCICGNPYIWPLESVVLFPVETCWECHYYLLYFVVSGCFIAFWFHYLCSRAPMYRCLFSLLCLITMPLRKANKYSCGLVEWKKNDFCWVWSLIIFSIQRSQPDVYPKKTVHPSTLGGARGTCPSRRGSGGLIPPSWWVQGPAVPQRGFRGSTPEAKNRWKFALCKSSNF